MQPPVAYLYVLPVELWLACWMFTSTRQRRRLSLVRRLFRSLCFPSLIERQSADIASLVEHIDRNNWVQRTHRLHRAAVRLERLAETPLVLAVRAWKITSAPPLRQRWTTPLAPDADWSEQLTRRMARGDYSHIPISSTSRPSIPSATESSQRMTIDTSLRQTLASLSQLQELILDGCVITPPDGVLLNLERFTISATRQPGTSFRGSASDEDTASEGRLEIVHPQYLVELYLHAAVQSAALINGFRDATFSNLRHLSLHALFNPYYLLDLLKRCPRLESLAIASIYRSSGKPLPKCLPQHVVPLLRNLTIPWDLVGLFTLNRPISAVTVLNVDGHVSIDNMKGVLIDILRSSAPIRSLVIPCTTSTIETLAFITSSFPALPELSMDIPERDKERRVFRCGNGNGEDLCEDTRSPELNDELAFDDLPTDALSDSEEHPPPIHPAQSHLRSVILWPDLPSRLTTIPVAKEDPPLPVRLQEHSRRGIRLPRLGKDTARASINASELLNEGWRLSPPLLSCEKRRCVKGGNGGHLVSGSPGCSASAPSPSPLPLRIHSAPWSLRSQYTIPYHNQSYSAAWSLHSLNPSHTIPYLPPTKVGTRKDRMRVGNFGTHLKAIDKPPIVNEPGAKKGFGQRWEIM
ncbi:hypothetical protein B0H13DRAFT_2261896 [Mycena leptocephala]|nr:hypothetical protein B0H13DRAFT_2261896 [Mycena leptocephala]